ncbi:protein of unknown function DUF899 thioredoxin family protein [Kribbella flavida DSM 17836]|uniref:Thioredoxin domain-containing protein n=1 Tax=Kribbella flavida (strain DSM 17836 / JCM 10339 / NBRC 14399) TaxID=479435 RepID=D2PXM7_KRIFD|nr:DUF899 domain-containing protein [Kribbella flavida]ADB31669.1 protein of unknown function DUF899 thioredoxin family protein [Kribbella flavida DSM 17836]
MNLPDVVSREQWLVARKQLLAEEKEFTRRRDALNANRRRLPMVLVEKDYRFAGPDGEVGLADLFEGRAQLVVYHFMFQPEWDAGCPNCSGFADEIGRLDGLTTRETTFVAISRAPYEKIAAYRQRMGWTFPWYSSYGSDFNYDYHVTLDPAVVPVEYNYRGQAEWDALPNNTHLQGEHPFDLHGLSCFLRTGDAVHHTYSTYGRGTDAMGFAVNAIDLTALGRQEPWEEPQGRTPGTAPMAGDPRITHRETAPDTEAHHCH